MMQDNDYYIIKPVENPQNVGAMTPIDRQAQKRQRQQQREQRRKPTGQDERRDETEWPDNGQTGPDSIDYRA